MFEWYQKIYFKANADKFYLFLSSFSNYEMTIANCNIASSNFKELLEVVIDNEVTIAKHIENLCWNINQKFHAQLHSQPYDLRKAPLSYEITRKGSALCTLYTMINAQLFSVARERQISENSYLESSILCDKRF